MLCKNLAIVFALSLFATGCSQPANVMSPEEEAAATASDEQAVAAERDRYAAEAKAKKSAKN